MAIEIELLEELIRNGFPDATIRIEDLAGDKDHYALEIGSNRFTGRSRVEQHRMVNEALHGYLGGSLHALSIKTHAFEEAL